MPTCPGCGKKYSSPPINTRCDVCGCAFCFNGNCVGTIGGSTMSQSGSGRSAGRTCPKCGKGKLKKV